MRYAHAYISKEWCDNWPCILCAYDVMSPATRQCCRAVKHQICEYYTYIQCNVHTYIHHRSHIIRTSIQNTKTQQQEFFCSLHFTQPAHKPRVHETHTRTLRCFATGKRMRPMKETLHQRMTMACCCCHQQSEEPSFWNAKDSMQGRSTRRSSVWCLCLCLCVC